MSLVRPVMQPRPALLVGVGDKPESMQSHKNNRRKNMKPLDRLSALMKGLKKVLLVGDPATAKTSMVHQAAKQLGWDVVVFRASLCERVDFSGAFVPDIVAGVTRLLPMELIAMLKQSTRMIVLFLDEIGQAPTEVQSAVLSLFDKGALPPNVVIWAATNRVNARGVTTIVEPLRSRFDSIYEMPSPTSTEANSTGTLLCSWKEIHKSWVNWALDQGYPAEIVGFHGVTANTVPSPLWAWKPSVDPAVRMPDFRTWESAASLWADGWRDVTTYSAVLGKEVAMLFTAFAALREGLPTLDEVWANPDTALVPTSSNSQYFMAAMLCASVTKKNGSAFMRYIVRLDKQTETFAGATVLDREVNATPKVAIVSACAEWQPWFIAHEHLFRLV